MIYLFPVLIKIVLILNPNSSHALGICWVARSCFCKRMETYKPSQWKKNYLFINFLSFDVVAFAIFITPEKIPNAGSHIYGNWQKNFIDKYQKIPTFIYSWKQPRKKLNFYNLNYFDFSSNSWVLAINICSCFNLAYKTITQGTSTHKYYWQPFSIRPNWWLWNILINFLFFGRRINTNFNNIQLGLYILNLLFEKL